MPTVMGEIASEENQQEGYRTMVNGIDVEGLASAVVGAIMGALDGNAPAHHAAHPHHGGHHGHRMMQLPNRPAWRAGQLAPGIHAPDEGLEIMPMAPNQGNGIFTSAITTITWNARPQRPFKGERLLTQVTKNGTTALAVQWQGTTLFIGTQPQQLQIANFNLEVFSANAFGVRMSMEAAEPGIDIVLPTQLTGALTNPDNVVTSVMILGKSIR